jgi:predicted ATPase
VTIDEDAERLAGQRSHAKPRRALARTERQAFPSFAVIAGGFTADAGIAVAPTLSLDVLARLVDKSLVTVLEGAGGRTRYRLLETVRQFALELLVAADDLDAARDRHLRHVATLADAAREEWLRTGAQRFVNELDDDYANVRTALAWAAESDACAGMRALPSVRDLFFRFGQAEGLRLAQVLLAALGYTVGFERFNAYYDHGAVEPITVRVTHVYRREDGEWKIVHRHGDTAPADQSPPTP